MHESDSKPYRITHATGGAAFAVHVIPRARKNEISGRHGEAVKVRLTAPPVEGAANKALVKFLAECLDVPESRIEIISGKAARDKLVCVLGMSPEQLEAQLAALT